MHRRLHTLTTRNRSKLLAFAPPPPEMLGLFGMTPGGRFHAPQCAISIGIGEWSIMWRVTPPKSISRIRPWP